MKPVGRHSARPLGRLSLEGRRIHLLSLILLLAALIPLALPFLEPGFQLAHDRTVPFMRVAALAEALEQGRLPPRWFPQFDGGYGSPYPSFYAMGFYYLGVLLSWLGLSVGAAVEAASMLVIIASALAMYALADRLWGPLPALAGALLYSYAPYHLVDAYERGAYSELTAFVWFPLITLGLLGLVRNWRGPWRLLAPISIFGLLISHNIMPLVFLPAALVLALAVGFLSRGDTGRPPIRALVWVIFVGSLLACLIWLPILLERSRIHSEYFLQFDYRGDFVGVRELLGISQFNQFTTALGLPHLTLAAAAAVGLVLRRRRYPMAPTAAASLVLAAGFAYLTNHRSDWLWQLLPWLQFAQFPWRMLAPASFFISLAACSAISLLPAKVGRPLAVVAVGAITIVLFSPLARVNSTIEVAPTANSEICQEVWGTQDYRPIWSEAVFWSGSEPPDPSSPATYLAPCPQGPSIHSGTVSPAGGSYHSGTDWSFEYSADQPTTITIPQFYYPGWQVLLDGRLIRTSPEALTGLLQVSVPAGEGELRVRYRQTPAQRAGTASFLAGALLLLATPLIWPALGWEQSVRREPRRSDE